MGCGHRGGGRNADLGSLFHGANGASWENFVPTDGSAIDFGSGYGAQSRLEQLLQKYYGQSVPDITVKSTTPTVTDTGPSSVYHIDTSHEMSGAQKDILVLAHDQDLALDTGSIHLSFNADTVSGWHGLISKSAVGYDDDFSAWIQNGSLNLCFENSDGKQVRFSAAGIQTDTDYDLLITFDEDKVKVWLGDKQIGEAAFDFDMSDNGDSLVLGGVNGQSTRGTTDKVMWAFDGTLSNLSVYDAVLTPAEFASLEAQRHADDLAQTTTPAHSITY